jgi:hypothetical protein
MSDTRSELPTSAQVEGRPAEEAAPVVPLRPGKGSLVRRLTGGRSVGARPISIDFPEPKTVAYEFTKPFVGRAQARVSFVPVPRRTRMLTELALSILALAAFAIARRHARGRAVSLAGGVLLLSLACLAAVPGAFAVVLGGPALVMGVCLGTEALGACAHAAEGLLDRLTREPEVEQ